MDQRAEELRSSLEVAIYQRDQALERAQRLSEGEVKTQRIIENIEVQVGSSQKQEGGSNSSVEGIASRLETSGRVSISLRNRLQKRRIKH